MTSEGNEDGANLWSYHPRRHHHHGVATGIITLSRSEGTTTIIIIRTTLRWCSPWCLRLVLMVQRAWVRGNEVPGVLRMQVIEELERLKMSGEMDADEAQKPLPPLSN